MPTDDLIAEKVLSGRYCQRLLGRIAVLSDEECWLWLGWRNRGYGKVQTSKNGIRKSLTVHRFIWWWTNGPIPRGMSVCHHCDTPPCCNPAHMFLGTQAENNEDCRRKGRKASASGEHSSNHRLTEAQVEWAIERLFEGEQQKKVAQSLGVSCQAVWKIWWGKAWPGVKVRVQQRRQEEADHSDT